MHLDDISPEIQLEMLLFCPPSDLAALSRVHTSLRDVAEYTLYNHIDFFTQPFNLKQDKPRARARKLPRIVDMSLFHTLSTSERKAAMVKSLYVELEESIYNEGQINPVVVEISDSLKKMSNLVDFRILYRWWDDLQTEGHLSQVIRGGHFQLRTLWLEHGHDIWGIIADQPNLRFLGIFYDDDADKYFWRKIRGLFRDASVSLPRTTLYMLKRCGRRILTLELFPSSHHPGEVLQECREFARSLKEFPQDYYFLQAKCRLAFNLFGLAMENLNLLAEVMEGIATYFPVPIFMGVDIIMDDATMQPWRFPRFIKALSLFQTAEDFIFNFRGLIDNRLGAALTDVRACMANDLGEACPNVRLVRFRHAFRSTTLHRASNWSPTRFIWDGNDDDYLFSED